MIKNEKEDHPSIPSFETAVMIDDFFSEEGKTEVIAGVFLSPQVLDECLKLKGSMESLREHMQHIQESPKRKTTITDWPSTLRKWKAPIVIPDHLPYAEKLCEEFHDFKKNQSWRCSLSTDRNKDQKGIVFECIGPAKPHFIPLTDKNFEKKCEEFIKSKKMRKSN